MKRYIKSSENIYETLTTTPSKFMLMKESKKREWYSNTLRDVKCDLYIHGKLYGGFYGVFRSFDDDYYYIGYFDKDSNKFEYKHCYRNFEFELVHR